MAGVAAFGTSLSRGQGDTDPGPETFDPIANITSLSGPSMSRDTIDVTAHDSPNKYMEFVASLIDGGEVTCDINWDPADESLDSANTTTTLMGDLEDTEPINYAIAFPDGSKFAAALLITGFEFEANFDDKLSASLSFKVSGLPTFTAAA